MSKAKGRGALPASLGEAAAYARWGVNTIRFEGIRVLLWRVLKLALRPWGQLDSFHFCRQSLADLIPRLAPGVSIAIEEATAADVDALAPLVRARYGVARSRHLFAKRSIEATLRERFQDGARCFVGRSDGDLVAYNWIFVHRYEWGHRQDVVELDDDEALCDDAFTAAEWRGRGIHGAIHAHMLRTLQANGYRRAYTLVKADNISSSKALRRLHWDFFGTWVCFVHRRSGRSWAWQVRGTAGPFLAPTSAKGR